MTASPPDPGFETLLDYLRRERSLDFTGYKRNSLTRRIQRRMETSGHSSYADYLAYLQAHPTEYVELFNTILINVTSFFRDGDTWDYIRDTLIPAILAHKHNQETIRIWSAGCAGGQEAYTIAILMAEVLGDAVFRTRVKIYATDMDEDALNQARYGTYSQREVESVPPDLLDKYFHQVNQRYTFRKDLRRSLIFGRHDLVQNAPISRLDLLICRNVLIYFGAQTQARILSRLNFALNPSGYLVLGRAEMLLTHTNYFTPVDLRKRVFIKVPQRQSILRGTQREDKAMPMANDEIYLHNRIFHASPVAQVVVNAEGAIAMINERAQTVFNLSARDRGRPFQDLEVSYRPIELRSAVTQAYEEKRVIPFTDVAWPTVTGESRWYDVQVVPLFDGGTRILGVAINFTDVTLNVRLQERLEHTNQELETAYEELQSTNEELETTNEELQSTVEELETTNEELHSTVEELETTNEELNSSNEELEATNDELQRRSQQLNHVNGFMEAIFTGLPSGLIVLDPEQRVQVWNARAEELWGLRAEEAVGQHFLSLDIGYPVERLKSIIRSCLNGDTAMPPQTVPATNRRGKPLVCKTICIPLRDPDEAVTGVIVMMEEVEAV